MPATEYDAVAYPSHALSQTHPDRLAAIGTLLGMSPAPVERCRVLELGCGDGNNLIPMAMNYPESEFLGIDLAETPVAHGNRFAAELGLENLTLKAEDLLRFPASAGQFDYIIAHGLYSWVPQFVRDKVMAVCRDHLSPNGIAYISYNTMPGGHIRGIFRDIMRFHTRQIDDPAGKIEQATSIVKFLAAGCVNQNDVYLALVQDEMKRSLLEKNEAVLFHDDLADVNQAYYFHEFIDHATKFQLKYLAEADFFELADHQYPPPVRAALEEMGARDPLLREQYLDFLKFRRFRQTLLVRENVGVERHAIPDRLRTLAISAQVTTVTKEPSLARGSAISFRGPTGSAVTIDQPLAKAALLHLGEKYPLPVPFVELLTAATNRPGLPVVSMEDETNLLDILSESYLVGLIELHAGPPKFVRHAGPLPETSRLARLQLQHGIDLVTNYRHSHIRVEPGLSRALIEHLDGTRDRAQLLNDLVEWAMNHPPEGEAPPDRVTWRARFEDQIEPGLEGVAAMALLLR